MNNILDICALRYNCGINNNKNIKKIFGKCENKVNQIDHRGWGYIEFCEGCCSAMCRYCIERNKKKCVNCIEKKLTKSGKCLGCKIKIRSRLCRNCGIFLYRDCNKMEKCPKDLKEKFITKKSIGFWLCETCFNLDSQ